mgnify:CR=1 FL=1
MTLREKLDALEALQAVDLEKADVLVEAAALPARRAEIEGMIKAARRKMELKYEAQMDGYDNYEVEIWEGIPYVEILKYAREKNGDLIVMAHHTREIDPEQALLGSTVEQVVLRASCPVASAATTRPASSPTSTHSASPPR